MDSWVTVLVAAITAGAAIGASAVTQSMQLKSSRQLSDEAAQRDERDALREALVELLRVVRQLESRISQAVAYAVSPQTSEAEVVEWTAANARAELLVAPETWETMQPYLQHLTLRTQILSLSPESDQRTELEQDLADLGVVTMEDALEERRHFIAAMHSCVAAARRP